MKTFASSEKGYNKQLAGAYIAGMMAGSYFHKCTYRSFMEEKHLYLHYAEMPKTKQYETEEKVLRSMARLEYSFLRAIGVLRCEIHSRMEEGNYVLEFDTGGFEALRCVIDPRGNCRIFPQPSLT